jgi:multiple sugar transport system permease protein
VLTRGGPGYSSDTLLHMLYVESFERLRAGYGAAITVIYLTCLAALTLVQQKSFDRKAHYQ